MRTVMIQLDKEYEIRFSTMALLRLERELGKPIVEAFKEIQSGQESFNLEQTFVLLRCGIADLAEKSIEEIAQLVDDHAPGETTMEKFANVFGSLIEGMTESMVGDEKKMNETVEKLQKKKRKTDGTGASSKPTRTKSESGRQNSGS